MNMQCCRHPVWTALRIARFDPFPTYAEAAAILAVDGDADAREDDADKGEDETEKAETDMCQLRRVTKLVHTPLRSPHSSQPRR